MNIFKILKENRPFLTRQQYSTLKGQAIAGDVEGAYKGLQTIKERKQVKENEKSQSRKVKRNILQQN